MKFQVCYNTIAWSLQGALGTISMLFMLRALFLGKTLSSLWLKDS
jgi:hypothetical protein